MEALVPFMHLDQIDFPEIGILSPTHTHTISLHSHWHTQAVSQKAQVYFILSSMSLKCEHYTWQNCTAFQHVEFLPHLRDVTAPVEKTTPPAAPQQPSCQHTTLPDTPSVQLVGAFPALSSRWPRVLVNYHLITWLTLAEITLGVLRETVQFAPQQGQ